MSFFQIKGLMYQLMPKEKKAQINFRARPEIIEGIDEVVKYLQANSVPGIRITKTDAFIHVINFFREHHQLPSKQKAKKTK
jgi:hypothetical protein